MFRLIVADVSLPIWDRSVTAKRALILASDTCSTFRKQRPKMNANRMENPLGAAHDARKLLGTQNWFVIAYLRHGV